MGSYASYAVRDAGGNIIGYQSAYTGQVTYEGTHTAEQARAVDTPQYVSSRNTAAEIAQMVGKTGGVVDPNLARIAIAEGAPSQNIPSAVTQQQQKQSQGSLPAPYISRISEKTTPQSSNIPQQEATTTLLRSTQQRAGYYAPSELGDSITQTRAQELMKQTNKPFSSYEDAVRYALEEQRQSATTSTARRFYANELSKSIQEPIEKASQYHYMAKETGRPQAANPYEYQADLAVELLKGAPTRSSEVFSPVSGEMSRYLPGGKEGVQQYQWNTALGKNEVVDFMPGIAALQAASGIEGPYGALYGGTGVKSITPQSVANIIETYPKTGDIPSSVNVPSALPFQMQTAVGQVKSTGQQTRYFSGGEYADLPLPFVSTSRTEEATDKMLGGGTYIVPNTLEVFRKGEGNAVPIVPGSYNVQTTKIESEPSIQNFLTNAGGYVWNTAAGLVRGFGVDLPVADTTAGLAKTTQTPSYDISLPSPYVSYPPSSEPKTEVTYSGGSPEITALGKWIDTNRPTLDLSDSKSVNQFNANVDKYNELIAANPVVQTTRVTPGYKPSNVIFHIEGKSTTVTEPTIKENIQESMRSYVPQSVKDWYNAPTKESGNLFVSGESGSFGIGTDYTNAFLKGVVKETLENPLDVAGTTAFATLLTGGIGKLGQVAAPVISKSPILETASRATPYVIGGVAAYGTAEEATSGFKDYTPKAAEKGGEIFAQSWLPFIAGGSLYSKAEALDVAGRPLPSVESVIGPMGTGGYTKSWQPKHWDSESAAFTFGGNVPKAPSKVVFSEALEKAGIVESKGSTTKTPYTPSKSYMPTIDISELKPSSGAPLPMEFLPGVKEFMYGEEIRPYEHASATGKLPSTTEQQKVVAEFKRLGGLESNLYGIGESPQTQQFRLSRVGTIEGEQALASYQPIKLASPMAVDIPKSVGIDILPSIASKGLESRFGGAPMSQRMLEQVVTQPTIKPTFNTKSFDEAISKMQVGARLKPVVSSAEQQKILPSATKTTFKPPSISKMSLDEMLGIVTEGKRTTSYEVPGGKLESLKIEPPTIKTPEVKPSTKINLRERPLENQLSILRQAMFERGGKPITFKGQSKPLEKFVVIDGRKYREVRSGFGSGEIELELVTEKAKERTEKTKEQIKENEKLSENTREQEKLRNIGKEKEREKEKERVIEREKEKEKEREKERSKVKEKQAEREKLKILGIEVVGTKEQTREKEKPHVVEKERELEREREKVLLTEKERAVEKEKEKETVIGGKEREKEREKEKITTKEPPKIKIPVIPLIKGGAGFGGGGGGADKRRRYKKHEEIFSYNFDPWKAARITAKALAVGSNVTRGPKSSLPTSIFTQKPNIAVTTQKKVSPMVATPKKASVSKVVVPKFNMPAQKKMVTPQFAMPKIGVSKSTNAMKPISLLSSLPQQKKKVKK